MRTALALVFFIGVAGVSLQAVPNRISKKDLVRADKRQLQGSWVMVKWQRAASVVVYNPHEKFYVWTIQADRLTAKQGGLGWPMDSMFTIDPTNDPKTMDAVEVAGSNKGNIGRYIYQLDGDTLTVCHGGIGQGRPKDFTGKGTANQIVIVFTKVKP
jgi:uncharacterized protein (TIGR03067 family)